MGIHRRSPMEITARAGWWFCLLVFLCTTITVEMTDTTVELLDDAFSVDKLDHVMELSPNDQKQVDRTVREALAKMDAPHLKVYPASGIGNMEVNFQSTKMSVLASQTNICPHPDKGPDGFRPKPAPYKLKVWDRLSSAPTMNQRDLQHHTLKRNGRADGHTRAVFSAKQRPYATKEPSKFRRAKSAVSRLYGPPTKKPSRQKVNSCTGWD